MIGDRPFDDTIANTPFDTIIEVLMAVMLLFLPLAFGGTEAWSQETWCVIVAAMGLCVCLKQAVYRGSRTVWNWTYLPIVLFVSLIFLQQIQLPAGVLKVLSPGTLALRGELLPGVAAQPTSLSLYAFVTGEQARLVLAVCVIFVVVLHEYRAPMRVRRLLMTVTGAGVAVAAVAAYQDLTGAKLIYGLIDIGHKNAGPFQNYSHFSQFMNLSVGGAAALLLLTVSEWLAADPDPRAIVEELKDPQHAFVWPALALCLLGPVLVFWSMSRMGMISMLVAGGVMAGLLGWRTGRGSSSGRSGGRRGPGGVFLMLCLGVMVLAALLVIGFDVVYDRLATLRHVEVATYGRWQMLQDMTAIYARFPMLGVGLGTHEYVFPMFSHSTSTQIATHAENEYAQLLEECGGVGLALALVFIGLIVAAFVKSVWRPKRPEQYAAFGLGFGLLAILLHSFSDFGQHVPANAALTATFAALLINTARSKKGTPQMNAVLLQWWTRPLRIAVMMVFVICAGWIIVGTDRARRAVAASVQAGALASRLDAAPDAGSVDDYRELLQTAGVASALLPRNAAYRYRLNVYRWQVINRNALDAATGQMAFTPELVGFTRTLVDEFDAVYAQCPTFGPPLCMAGQIRVLVLGDVRGEAQVDQAYRLTPYDQTVCSMKGWLAIRRQDWDTAREALDRFLLLGGPRWQVVDMYLRAERPDLAFAVAKADRWNLERLAGGLATGWPKEGKLLAGCREESRRMVIAESERPGSMPDAWAERGRLEVVEGHPEAAVSWYTKAIDTDYGRVDWRLALAQALAATGNRDEALRHLRICLRVRPNMSEAEKLLATYGGGRSIDGPAVR